MGLRLPRRAAPPQRVRLLLDGGTPLEAAVLRTVEGGTEIALTSSGAPPARALHRRRAVLTGAASTPDRHVVLLAVRDATGGLRDEVLHAVWAGDVSQRRAFARVPAFRPVELVPELRALRRPAVLQGVTRDISAGGALLGGRSAAVLNAGERLALSVVLDDEGGRVDAAGLVIRADPEAAVAAVRLEAVAPEDVERLVRWVRHREIDALSRLRG